MNPEPAISSRVVSERRAAAARANGAKSRGPVTAQGRANSSRNSYRHGLRSGTLFNDPGSLADLAVELATFERDFAPRSGIEHNLVRMMAVAYWRQACLRKLETAMLNREVRRLQSLMTGEDPITLLAHAFRSLSDRTCFLRIFQLEARFERQYVSAFRTLTEHRRWRAECAASRIPEKVNRNERTQQATENTAPHFATTQETTSNELHSPQSQPVGNPNPEKVIPEKVILDERTQQASGNAGLHVGTTAKSEVSGVAASARN